MSNRYASQKRVKVVVVGAGIIGASIAYHLAKLGAEVTLIDEGLPATRASGASFGWVNASFFLDDHHHAFRKRSLDALKGLSEEIATKAVDWCGALWWEKEGDELDSFVNKLSALEYPNQIIYRKQFAELVPDVGEMPDRAVLLPTESAMDTPKFTFDLINAAKAKGAVVITGLHATSLVERNDKVVAVATEAGPLQCDHCILAIGSRTQEFMAPFGIDIPMLRRPGAILTTKPVATKLRKVMVAPFGEFRQDKMGRIIAPTVIDHQADNSELIGDDIEAIGAMTLERISSLLPSYPLETNNVAIANRPVPADGLPAIGPIGPKGLYVATMHSGVTLSAIVGSVVAKEILSGESEPFLKVYSPKRFSMVEHR